MFDTAASSTNPEQPYRRNRWAKVAAWIAGCAAALVLLLLSIAVLLLHSAKFHQYLLATAQQKASDALGTQVQIHDFAAHLSTLSLDLDGIIVHGAEPHTNPPLLVAQHLSVGIRVVSVLSRKWYLQNIQVDQPVVRVFVAADGTSNLPKPKSSGGSSNTNLFELGVRHAMLTGGEVYYNDKKSALEADLHDVNFSSTFNNLLQKYSGTLSYRNGHLQAGNFNPVAHDLDAAFEATPDVFHLTRARLSIGASQLQLVATLKDYSNPNIDAHYDAVLDAGDVRRILKNSSVPTGIVQTQGTVQYRFDPKVSLLNTVVLAGNFTSRRLDVQASGKRVQLENVAAQYSLLKGNVAVQNLRARLLGGDVNATYTMHNLAGPSQSKLNATLRRISLADVKRLAANSPATRELALGGSMNATVNAAWGNTLADLTARTDATVHGTVSRAPQNGVAASNIPVNGVLHETYTAANTQLALRESYLRTPQTNLTMNGIVSDRSGLAIHLQSNDLRELETLADLVTPPGANTQPLNLGGSASFQGMVRGSLAAPHITGQLVATNFQVRGTSWRVVRTNVEADPSLLSLQHADLEPISSGRIAFNATAHLTKWSLNRNSSIQLELHASQLDVANLEKILGSAIPVSGTLAANINAHGSIDDPIGQGNVSLANAKIYAEPVSAATLAFTGANKELHGKLAVQVAAGSIQGNISVRPAEKTYTAQLTANGVHLDQLQTLQAHNIDATGLLDLHGSGAGSFDNPQFNATLHVPKLDIHQQAINGITLQAVVANHVAIAHLDAGILDTPVKAVAKINLSGDYFTDAVLDTQAVSLAPLLAMSGSTAVDGVNGQTEIHATLRGPLKNKNLIEAHAVLPMLKMTYGTGIQLAAVSPIHIDYARGIVNVQRTQIRGTDTDLQVQGSIPVAGHGPMSLLLLGTINLQLAQILSPDIRSSGELKFNINSYGGKADPNVQGQIKIVNASFSSGDLPVGIQHGNGVLTLTKNRLNINSFKATMGGGTLTAQGGLVYSPTVQFDIGASAQGVRMIYPQNVREELDADLRLTGSSDDALLGGQVQIQNLSFTPNFDLTTFMSQLSGGVTPPPGQGFSQNIQLNLVVNTGNNIAANSRALSIGGTANLEVHGTAAQPVILGRINLNNGDVIFNGSRFTLAGGTIEFINPAETQPVVNLTLNTTIQQYNIVLRFNGPVDQLRTNYASDPSLPAADIISLLAFGQTTGAGPADPMASVASGVTSQVTSRVAKVAGISQLSINPVLNGNTTQGPAGAIVTVQQKVTGNLFVTFSTNVASTQNQVIMGQYRISPRVAISVTRNQTGGFGFDTTFKKTW